MKFKPLHDRVLIEVLDGSEKTAGGIIIPDTAQEKPQEGKVVAVGGGAIKFFPLALPVSEIWDTFIWYADIESIKTSIIAVSK